MITVLSHAVSGKAPVQNPNIFLRVPLGLTFSADRYCLACFDAGTPLVTESQNHQYKHPMQDRRIVPKCAIF